MHPGKGHSPYACLLGMAEMEWVVAYLWDQSSERNIPFWQSSINPGVDLVNNQIGICWMAQEGLIEAFGFPYKGNFYPTQLLIEIMRDHHETWKDVEDAPVDWYARVGFPRPVQNPELVRAVVEYAFGEPEQSAELQQPETWRDRSPLL